MRKGFALALAIFCCLWFSSVWALPPGSYTKSCFGCRYVASIRVLSCRCRTGQSPLGKASSLKVPANCNYIVNNRGNLQCSSRGPRPPLPPVLPAGNYKRSCTSCTYNRGSRRLTCRCRRADGSYRWTSKRVYSGCAPLQNVNGQLQCRGYRPPLPPRLPAGNYKRSCTSCTYANNRLRCRCKTRFGAWRWSSIYVGSRCTPITNSNGRLRCHRSRLPAGNYKRTCRNCSFNGRWLACSCQMRNRYQWRSSRIRVRRGCAPIQNINGQLTCSGGGRYY